ncbi:LmeA family phospholipid-binding protein [Selenihalanaerobacter shriftii]|uniref:DUF2993 domain-containing protein n=1 Tax=Selenihalanaerobacter shriftii TaxID=142842 RepID=A0A1T4KL05_9FIRM|nr:DUF2993 domain-containing protein [Selenihalanaerobacter shriftii]SJZ43047.1 Protein of unknown function [Selenihalanaerobacter shriftii]
MKRLTIVILLVLVISQLFLPGYFSNKLETGLEDQFKVNEYLEAEVNTFPALLMLTGKFQSVDLKGEDLTIDGLKVAKLQAKFTDVKLKPIGQKDSKWQLVAGKNQVLRLTLKEEDLQKYLADRLDVIKDLNLVLSPEQTIVTGKYNFFGNEIPLKLAGNFQLKDDKEKLTFIPNGLQVGELMVPKEINRQLMQNINFSLDLTKLPIPLQVNEIKVDKDKLLILGGVDKK